MSFFDLNLQKLSESLWFIIRNEIHSNPYVSESKVHILLQLYIFLVLPTFGDSQRKFVETAKRCQDKWRHLARIVRLFSAWDYATYPSKVIIVSSNELSFCCRFEHTQKRRDRKWKAGSPFGRAKIRRRTPTVRWVPVCLFARLCPIQPCPVCAGT